VLTLVIIVIHPPIMIFLFSIAYVLWGLIEGWVAYQKRIRAKIKEKKSLIEEKKV